MINNLKLVNQTILYRNQKYFDQAQDTVFTVPSFSDHTDFIDTQNQNNKNFQNKYSNSNLNNITLKLLNNLYLFFIPHTKKNHEKII